MRRTVYTFILIIILAFLGGFSTYLAVAQMGNQNSTVTVTATPDMVWQPPPPGGIARPTLWLNINFMGKLTRLEMSLDGKLKAPLEATTPDYNNRCKLVAAEGTKILTAVRLPATKIVVERVMAPPLPPPGSVIIGNVYDFIPSGITFEPPVRLVLTYNPNELPQNTSSVVIAYYDPEQNWIEAEINGVAEAGLLTARISHLTLFAVLAKVAEPAPAPAPASFELSNLTISPSQAQLNQEVTISIKATNTGGTSGSYSLELKVNGTVKSSKQVTVAAGTSQAVNFTITGDAVGKHRVEVAGLNGEFEVVGPPPSPSGFNWWLIGGMTGVILVLAIGLIAWRRRLRG